MAKAKKLVSDIVEVGAKAAISMVPNPFGTLFTLVVDKVKENALAKRQEQWQTTVEARLAKLESSLSDIANSDSFATALLRTTNIAMKTSSDEKRKYLANALVNCFVLDLEEEKAMILFDLIERYTITHIRILYFFHDPTLGRGYVNGPLERMSSPMAELALYLKKYGYEAEYVDKAVKDLWNDSTLEQFTNGIMTGNGALAKRTTKLGDELLQLINGGTLDD